MTRTHSMPAATGALLGLLMLGVASTGVAQVTKPVPAKMPPKAAGMPGMQEKPGMMDMKEMMNSPHHVLVMAYRDNMANFAKAVKAQVTKTSTVDLDLARPAVAEMRHSFDLMHEQAEAQHAMMGDKMMASMSAEMAHMTDHMAKMGEHLTALEAEIGATAPDAKKVMEHSTEIMRQCADMAMMPAKAKTPGMK